jgi:hypothetical protein
MLHYRVAIWSHLKNDYQVYNVSRDNWPTIRLTPTNTERTNSFYFAEGPGDTQSRNVTLHMPRARIHTHITMAIWHTGGWLCRRAGEQRVAVLPLLAVSDPSKLPWGSNVGLQESRDFQEWLQFQTPFFYRPIIANRILSTEPEVKPELPTLDPIPLFVAEALLKDATCPITMDPVEKGDAAVTSCFHVFQRDAIEQWLVKQNTCPVCKKACVTTVC